MLVTILPIIRTINYGILSPKTFSIILHGDDKMYVTFQVIFQQWLIWHYLIEIQVNTISLWLPYQHMETQLLTPTHLHSQVYCVL